jgi:hypothetical protein
MRVTHYLKTFFKIFNQNFKSKISMKNLQTLATELAANKMQLLVTNDMLNLKGGKKGTKKGTKKRTKKGTKNNYGGGYGGGCGCGCGHGYGY